MSSICHSITLALLALLVTSLALPQQLPAPAEQVDPQLNTYTSTKSALPIESNGTIPENRVECFGPGVQATIATCTPLFLVLRGLIDYREKIRWTRDSVPKVYTLDAYYRPRCRIFIDTGEQAPDDEFSIYDIAVKAGNIVRECELLGPATGGYGPVGPKEHFWISIMGIVPPYLPKGADAGMHNESALMVEATS